MRPGRRRPVRSRSWIQWLPYDQRSQCPGNGNCISDYSKISKHHNHIGRELIPSLRKDWKPESEPALKEVAKLLQNSPSLKVWVRRSHRQCRLGRSQPGACRRACRSRRPSTDPALRHQCCAPAPSRRGPVCPHRDQCHRGRKGEKPTGRTGCPAAILIRSYLRTRASID